MRTTKTFIDTNVLVYAVDEAFPSNRRKARSVLRSLVRFRTGVVSTQVMQELYRVLVDKLKFERSRAKTTVLDLQNFEVISITPNLVELAIDLTILHSLSIWDALLVAAAREARCAVLFTEDLQHDAVIAGVRVENPFASGAP